MHSAEYDGLGRRIQKTVTHSGDLDGAFAYLYSGNQIIEVRNGADDVELLMVHGTRYIGTPEGTAIYSRAGVVVHAAEYDIVAALFIQSPNRRRALGPAARGSRVRWWGTGQCGREGDREDGRGPPSPGLDEIVRIVKSQTWPVILSAARSP